MGARSSLFSSGSFFAGLGLALLVFSTSACRAFSTECDAADLLCDPAALLLYNAPCHARSWSTYFGALTGTGEFAEAVVQSSDSGYILAGRAFEPFGAPIRAFSSPGTRNIMVIKFSEDGVYQWHTFLGETADRPVSMVATADGYVVAGAATASFGGPRQAFSTANDAIVAKIDLNGNLLWHTYFGTAGSEEVRQIVSDGAGNFVLAGKSLGDIPNAGPVVVSNTNPATDQIFVMKIDGEGAPLWQSHFGGAGAETANKIALFQDGYVVGSQGDTAFASAFTNQRNAVNGGGSDDFALVGIDFNGNYLWHSFQGGAGTADDLTSVRALADGRILVGGNSTTTWGNPVNPHPDSGLQPAMAFFTLTKTGDLSWNAFYGNAGGSGSALQMATQTSNGEIAFLGSATASFALPRRPYQGLSDFVVGSLDAVTGALLRHSFYGGPVTNELALPNGFLPSCDNGFLVTGVSDGNFGDPIEAYAGTGNQAYVLKITPKELE
ncbi:MAG: hypothetical protein RIF32_19730 [Leptospirales bacterium]|jgi:hypothetical protein